MKLKSSVLIGGKSDEYDRHNSDFYPTPVECTHALMLFLNLKPDTILWECACGDGSMSEVLNKYATNVYSSDIREDNGYGDQIDFLKSNKKMGDVVITNPPFDVASAFIEKCCNMELQVYAMLLKSTFWHSKSRVELFRKTKPTYILPLTWRPNFAPNRGSSPTMDVIWTVWIAGETRAEFVPSLKPTAWEIKQKKQRAKTNHVQQTLL